MWETAVIVTVIISALGAALTALSCVLGRPIAVLWDRCLRRRGWLPADVEGQTPSDPDCQGRSNVAEGGSSQGPTEEPSASAVGDVGHAIGEAIGEGSAESRTSSALRDELVELVSTERDVWAEEPLMHCPAPL